MRFSEGCQQTSAEAGIEATRIPQQQRDRRKHGYYSKVVFDSIVGSPQQTKYEYIKSTTVYVPTSELGPPPRTGGGAHSPAGEGLGVSQFRRLEKKLSTLPIQYSTLCHNPSRDSLTKFSVFLPSENWLNDFLSSLFFCSPQSGGTPRT